MPMERYNASLADMMSIGEIEPDKMPRPNVANVVYTWRTLPEEYETTLNRKRRRRNKHSTRANKNVLKYTIDQRSFVRHNPTAKLNTNSFAAVICRAADHTTALMFTSGSGVAVHARSSSLGIYACRVYTHILSKTPQLMMPEDTDWTGWSPGCGWLPNAPIMTTLEGRLCFDNCWRENIVAFGFLGCRVNLELISKTYPDVVTYDPDLFPGLEYRSTVVDPSSGKEKMVKNLIFDTGKWLIIGAQDVSVADRVFWRLRKLAQQFRVGNDGPPGEERQVSRLNRLWKELYAPVYANGTAEEVSAIMPTAAPKTTEELIQDAESQIAVNREARKKDAKARERKRLRKAAQKVGAEAAEEREIREQRERQERDAREIADGYDALMIAATRGDVRNVNVLLDLGYNPAVINNKGESILHLIREQDTEDFNAIRDAILTKLVPTQYHQEVFGYDRASGARTEEI